MKKYISCLLLAVMLFTLFGCGQKPEAPAPAAPAEQPAVESEKQKIRYFGAENCGLMKHGMKYGMRMIKSS